MTQMLDNAQDLVCRTGQPLGTSNWRSVGDTAIGDYQCAGRVSAQSRPAEPDTVPAGLLLSMIPTWLDDVVQFRAMKFGVNYGLDGVRIHLGPRSKDYRMTLGVARTKMVSEDVLRCHYDFSITGRDSSSIIISGIFIGQYFL